MQKTHLTKTLRFKVQTSPPKGGDVPNISVMVSVTSAQPTRRFRIWRQGDLLGSATDDVNYSLAKASPLGEVRVFSPYRKIGVLQLPPNR
jgi:hypothetical protein